MTVPILARCAFNSSITFLLLSNYFPGHENEVRINGHLSTLPPGEHGLLVHQNPVTNPNDCKGLGSHFDVGHHKHGEADSPIEDHHTGDLGNIKVGNNGEVDVEIFNKFISLENGVDNSVIGRSIAIHERADTGKPDEDGDSGNPIACCTIKLAKSKKKKD